jgi:hypothetical protein
MTGAMARHLNLRVAWHDNRWNGRMCHAPSKNSFCIDLDRIRTERKEDDEDLVHDKHFAELKDGESGVLGRLWRIHERQDVVANVQASLSGHQERQFDAWQIDSVQQAPTIRTGNLKTFKNVF